MHFYAFRNFICTCSTYSKLCNHAFYVFQFQDGEKKRYKAEQLRHELKQKKQLEELHNSAETTLKEFEQLQVISIFNYIFFFKNINKLEYL